MAVDTEVAEGIVGEPIGLELLIGSKINRMIYDPKLRKVIEWKPTN